MFVSRSDALNKMCPIVSDGQHRKNCVGSNCMFWRDAHEGTDPEGHKVQMGFCGAAPVAPHRDLTKRP